jgi:hypothetical protein
VLARLRRKSESGQGAGDVTPAARSGICANCGAAIDGAYCARCGQETSIALPTARTFLRDAAGRYVALDGRLWRTLFALFFRPGFLTREYLLGRRRRYVRPGRLFLVLSIALFAVFRLTGETPIVKAGAGNDPTRNNSTRQEIQDALRKEGAQGVTVDDGLNVKLDDLDGPWLGPLRSRIEAFNRLPPKQKADQLTNGVLRYGPYALVALLPVFAAFMQLAYLGRGRRYPNRPRRYAAHLVFGAHDHAFLFLGLMLFFTAPIGPLRVLVGAWIVVYLLSSMKVVYGGRWSGVILRATFVSLLYLVAFAVAMALLIVAAVAL